MDFKPVTLLLLLIAGAFAHDADDGCDGWCATAIIFIVLVGLIVLAAVAFVIYKLAYKNQQYETQAPPAQQQRYSPGPQPIPAPGTYIPSSVPVQAVPPQYATREIDPLYESYIHGYAAPAVPSLVQPQPIIAM
eukprot:NODE_1430_length_862_cov_238.024490_g1384_i0.p1 GENE.NODE_1430_length_862_cov_238.024490_g1384_i0~~NODE_1430_length_862_cov_238.024490_g1384_i0.p1  ORF type:complete len:134 (+),score=28.75 NODE_1430_length_862_cov_238.024490_g1384_i0:91-492(+)